jgi:hypothetical protein
MVPRPLANRLWLFPFCGSLYTNYYIMSCWACFVGHVLFKGGGYILIWVVVGMYVGMRFICDYNGYILIIWLNMGLRVT